MNKIRQYAIVSAAIDNCFIGALGTIKCLYDMEKLVDLSVCFYFLFGFPFGNPNPSRDFETDEKNKMCCKCAVITEHVL